MKMTNLIAVIICIVAMLINYKNINMILIHGFLAIINTILYIGG